MATSMTNLVNVILHCTTQGAVLRDGEVLNGVLQKNGRDVFFDETLPIRQGVRNPKLYEGKLLSMTCNRDGKYRINLKALEAGLNPEKYAFNVYCEVINALTHIAR